MHFVPQNPVLVLRIEGGDKYNFVSWIHFSHDLNIQYFFKMRGFSGTQYMNPLSKTLYDKYCWHLVFVLNNRFHSKKAFRLVCVVFKNVVLWPSISWTFSWKIKFFFALQFYELFFIFHMRCYTWCKAQKSASSYLYLCASRSVFHGKV